MGRRGAQRRSRLLGELVGGCSSGTCHLPSGGRQQEASSYNWGVQEGVTKGGHLPTSRTLEAACLPTKPQYETRHTTLLKQVRKKCFVPCAGQQIPLASGQYSEEGCVMWPDGTAWGQLSPLTKEKVDKALGVREEEQGVGPKSVGMMLVSYKPSVSWPVRKSRAQV